MTQYDLAKMRENYTLAGLDEADLAPDWLTQFDRWLSQAIAGGVTEPNAMVLSTASRDGLPAGRTVLAKAVDAQGVVFYTNYTSAKSHDLEDNPWAAATFPWYQLQRQVHIRGRVHRVDEATSLAYWRQRPRASQIGAWASPQSAVVSGRDELDRMQQRIQSQFRHAGPGAEQSLHSSERRQHGTDDGAPLVPRGSIPSADETAAPGTAAPGTAAPGTALPETALPETALPDTPVSDIPAQEIPLPPHWGGWRITPLSVEFWQGRSGRMHDRLRFRLISEHAVDDRWVVERLAP